MIREQCVYICNQWCLVHMFTTVNYRLFTFVNMEDKKRELIDLIEKYSQFRQNEIGGRYLTYSHIKPLLKTIDNYFVVEEVGRSYEEIPIHSVTLGKGKIKILAWSQMHGNESTTTKAVFDLLQAFVCFPQNPLLKLILERITLIIIPMLNPDGAFHYTRENANQTDLNRDALRLKEKESKLLRKIFKEFNPDYCLNLHDQRTIFGVGEAAYPATLSFLTPAMDEKRGIYPERIISMQVIASVVSDLRHWLPHEIGRYSDEFNPNCTGDTFQSLGKPTILFEAGHFPGDYQREVSRKFVVAALLSTLSNIAFQTWKSYSYLQYFEIPENKKTFYDIILRKVLINNQTVDVALQYKEVLEGDFISFKPCIERIADTIKSFGHLEIKGDNKKFTIDGGKSISENVIVNRIFLNNEVLAINYQNI